MSWQYLMNTKDQEAYIKEMQSEKLPMKQLSPEEHIRHISSKQCTQCDTVYNKNNRNVRHHDHETWANIGAYCNKCNLQLQHSRERASVKDRKQRKNANKGKFAHKATRNKFNKKWSKKRNHDGEDNNSNHGMYEDNFMISVIFHNLRGYDGQIIIKHSAKTLLQKTL